MARFSYSRPSRNDETPKTKITRETLREAAGLFAYLWPYRFQFALALVLLFLSNAMFLTLPYMVGSMVDSSTLGPAAGAEGDPAALVRQNLPKFDVNTTALILFGLLALQACSSFGHSILFASVGERSLADLRRDAYARLIRLPMTFFAQRRVGELTSRLSSDLAQIQDTLIMTLPHLIRQTTILVGGIALIALTSGWLTLVMLASLPALIIVAAVFGRLIRKVAREAQDRLADTNVVVEETLQGVAVVKSFSNEGFEQNRYQTGLMNFLTVALKGARYRAAFISFVIFCLFGGVVLVMWYGATLVQSGSLSLGQLARFMLYTMFVAGAMGSFAELWAQVQRTLGASHRVRELLQEEPESLPLPVPGVSTNGTAAGHRLRGDLVFDNVQFSYPTRKDVPVLRGVSLEARAGQRIALVGPSGAGKSTIVSLILRFYDPDAGRILIDGKDVKDFTLADLRSHLAIVPQDVLLFGGTVGENIAYGKPGCTDAEIEAAARKANAHDFIMSFPDGYKTLVGERGVQLSGGQRQRVAIARAILKNPEILLLDEATSSLDSESESLVQQALEVLMEGRTSVIIAHRLATVRNADRIYVIKEGQTVESGTHSELIEKEEGVYRNLSDLQFDLH